MTKLMVGSVANHPFAVRADLVEKTVEVQSFSRFMRGQRDDVVAAVIEDRVQFLTDLSVRLGLHGVSQRGRAGIITAPDEQISGVLAQDAPTTINVEDTSVLPVSSYVGSSVMDACALIGDQFVPILSEDFFSELQESAAIQIWTPSQSFPARAATGSSFIRVRVGAKECAFESEGFGESISEDIQVVPLPFAPPQLIGIARLRTEMVAVFDVATALGFDAGEHAAILLSYEQGDVAAYFAIAGHSGEVQGSVQDLPKLLARPGIRRAVETADSLLPVLDPSAVFEESAMSPFVHDVDSTFETDLFKRTVSVTEFSFGDFVYALPTEELGDELNTVRLYPFWASHPLVGRVACTEAGAMSDLDLARYLGHASEIATSQPLHVKNGDFEAIFSAERVLGKRAIEPAAQRPLPADLPHNLVYGCYLDGKEVRLILNLAAIAEHATDERLQNVLASMSTVHRRGLAPGRASTTPQATREQAAAEAPAAKSDTSLDTEPEDLSEEFVRGESVSSTESQSEENGVVSAAPADAGRKDGEASDEVLVPDTDSSEDFPAEPDIELDLEGDGAKDSEIPDEGAPDEEASPIALEIEPELTVDPQIVEWEESGMKAEATTDFNEHAATAPELPRVSEQTPRPEELSRDERRDDRAKRGSRKRRLVIPMVFVLIAATVGVILFFEQSVFDRLLAQAGDVFSGDVASESPEATDRSEAARDVPIAERAVPPNPPAEPSPAGSASREPATATAVEFSERVYFAADSAELLPSARQTLDQIVRRVNEGERWTIEIVGHVAQADHGTPESYRWLSEQRALTVRDYLVPRFSVEPAELSITGRGASDPAASNDSPDGRALNRRVVVVVESSVP